MIMHYGDCKHLIEKLTDEIRQWKLQISIKDETILELQTKNKDLKEKLNELKSKSSKGKTR